MSELVSYFDGIVYDDETVYVAAWVKGAADPAEPNNTVVFRFKGDSLSHIPVDGEVISLDIHDDPNDGRVCYFSCADGRVTVIDKARIGLERVSDENDAPTERSPLLAGRIIGDYLFLTGMLRRTYRRDLRSVRWVNIGRTIIPGSGEDVAVGFESIDGFSSDEVYAVGLDGEIFLFDGQQWKVISSPTNVNLAAVVCAQDEGLAYAVGDSGVILRGRQDSWEILADGDLGALTSVAAAFGSIYFAERGAKLYRLVENGVEVVDFQLGKELTTLRLHSKGRRLLSIGEDDLAIFDGQKWTRLGDP